MDREAKGADAMAFGLKMRVVKTRGAYTIEELYDAIKDVRFEAGTPELTTFGANTMITFPAPDGQNQCVIQNGSFKRSSQKFQVLKSQKVGASNAAGQAALDVATKGWNSLRTVVGPAASRVEQQVTEVADKLEQMGL